jgi:hypothetical protein
MICPVAPGTVSRLSSSTTVATLGPVAASGAGTDGVGRSACLGFAGCTLVERKLSTMARTTVTDSGGFWLSSTPRMLSGDEARDRLVLDAHPGALRRLLGAGAGGGEQGQRADEGERSPNTAPSSS